MVAPLGRPMGPQDGQRLVIARFITLLVAVMVVGSTLALLVAVAVLVAGNVVVAQLESTCHDGRGRRARPEAGRHLLLMDNVITSDEAAENGGGGHGRR
jgi:hypothetical protein